MKASLIIPFMNEKEYAELTMRTAFDYLTEKGQEFELVAVDDSTDGTWEILKEFEEKHDHVLVIKGGDPPGYGKALRQGFAAASGDIIIPFNGDLCDSLDDVMTYIQKIEEGYDMVFGSRYMPGGEIVDHPSTKVMISRLGNIFIGLLSGIKCDDITNTFKAYRKEVIEDVKPVSVKYDLGIELAMKAVKKGYTYTTVPVIWMKREFGASKMVVFVAIITHLRTAVKIWWEKD